MHAPEVRAGDSTALAEAEAAPAASMRARRHIRHNLPTWMQRTLDQSPTPHDECAAQRRGAYRNSHPRWLGRSRPPQSSFGTALHLAHMIDFPLRSRIGSTLLVADALPPLTLSAVDASLPEPYPLSAHKVRAAYVHVVVHGTLEGGELRCLSPSESRCYGRAQGPPR
eukprot:1223184-Rhodomonas_salina.1